MKYYIFKEDWKFDFLENEDPFNPYTGKPINLGVKLNLPKIHLKLKTNKIPDCIPNGNGYVIFNQNIISILKNMSIDYVQYFDIDVQDANDKIISNNYKCLNILNVIDAIDIQNSELKWSELYEGEMEEDRYIRDILNLKLKYSIINDELLFRLKGCEHLLVFREDLAQQIVDKGCTGLAFYNADGYSF